MILLVPVVLLALVSCASKEKRDPARPTEHKPFSQRLNESNGYKQDKTGQWVPKTDKRSSFERIADSPYFKGDARKNKEFKTGEYQKKAWWGNRNYKVDPYQGNTDGSRFQTTARQQGVLAHEQGDAAELPAEYATAGYATGEAREARARPVNGGSDAETDARRRVYQAPEVLDWREQRSVSREQTKSLLGR